MLKVFKKLQVSISKMFPFFPLNFKIVYSHLKEGREGRINQAINYLSLVMEL